MSGSEPLGVKVRVLPSLIAIPRDCIGISGQIVDLLYLTKDSYYCSGTGSDNHSFYMTDR